MEAEVGGMYQGKVNLALKASNSKNFHREKEMRSLTSSRKPGKYLIKMYA